MEYNGRSLKEGWICPICGRVISPYQKGCITCPTLFELERLEKQDVKI